MWNVFFKNALNRIWNSFSFCFALFCLWSVEVFHLISSIHWNWIPFHWEHHIDGIERESLILLEKLLVFFRFWNPKEKSTDEIKRSTNKKRKFTVHEWIKNSRTNIRAIENIWFQSNSKKQKKCIDNGKDFLFSFWLLLYQPLSSSFHLNAKCRSE